MRQNCLVKLFLTSLNEYYKHLFMLKNTNSEH